MGEMGSLGLHLERAFAPFSPHPVMEMGLNPPALFSFSAIRYFQRYGLSIEEGKRILAMIAVKNHHNGTLCPKAHLRREVTIEQVLNAPIIAWPFGLFDCCGNSDGGAAAIICSADMAKKFRPDPIFIKGLGISVNYGEPFLSPDFDTTHFEETVTAANQAYQEAGIKNPRQEISLAIVHDCFTATELITYEDLGFSPRGRAKEDVEAGTFTLEGSLPVNSDGGLKSFGHPTGATGLRMMYEIYKQIQGKAQLPARQLKNPQIGLVHNLGRSNSGTAYGGSVVGVAILGA
jgi:acetyl-CoA C-acetyltransferase